MPAGDWQAGLIVKIIKSLSALTDVLQKHANSIDKNTSSKQQTQEPQQLIIRSPIEIPPEIISEYRSGQNQNTNLQRWTLFIGFLTFLAVVIYTTFSYWQWSTMNDGLSQTQVSLRYLRRSIALNERQTLAAEDSVHKASLAIEESQRQSREVLRSNTLALQVTERSYVTLGRKDGIVAELTPPMQGSGNSGIVLFFQNSGHAPARFNWGPTIVTFIPPVDPSPIRSDHRWTPITRTKNRKNGSTGEGGGAGTVISGDSTYIADLGEVTPDGLRIIASRLLLINGTYEYCDELGTYSCRDFTISYQGGPFGAFRLNTETECPFFLRIPQNISRDTDYLSPCMTIGERQKKQAEDQKSLSREIKKRATKK